jgi:multisubunit Na+/H+ antiporter MnhC subunit
MHSVFEFCEIVCALRIDVGYNVCSSFFLLSKHSYSKNLFELLIYSNQIFKSLILSGTVDRRFVPIGKILKPLLNECVTPVTCYWSLALLLCDEAELLLVFQVSFKPILIC